MLNFIKKLFYSLLSILFILLVLSVCIFFSSDKFKGQLITTVIEKALYFKSVDSHIDSVEFNPQSIALNNLSINLSGSNKIVIPKLHISYEVQKKKLALNLSFNEIKTNYKNIKAEFNILYKTSFFKYSNTVSITTKQNNVSNLCKLKYNKSNIKIKSCDINIDNNSISLAGDVKYLNGEIQQIKLSTAFNNISLLVYKTFKSLFPEKLNEFLDTFIVGGTASGDVNVNILSDYLITPKSLSGNIKINNAELNYHPDFPNLTSLNTNLLIEGKFLHFKDINAKMWDINLENGDVSFAYNADDTIINIKCDADGKVKRLMQFIPEKELKKLKEDGIDLLQINSVFKGGGTILVPLDQKKKNSFDLSIIAKDLKLNILDNKVNIKANVIHGALKDEKITIYGNIFTNNLPSKLDIKYNIKDEHVSLQNKIVFKEKKIKNSFLSIDGSGMIDFKYNKNPKNTNLNAYLDLTKTAFRIKKLNIIKRAGLPMQVDVKSSDMDVFDFIVKGAQGKQQNTVHKKSQLIKPQSAKVQNKQPPISEDLNCKGKVTLSKKQLAIYYLQNYKIDISSLIQLTDNKFDATISGRFLDLSKYNLFESLKASDDSGNEINDIDITITIDKILAQNSVTFENFDLNMSCQNKICRISSANTLMNGKDKTSISLTHNNNAGLWNIKSDNAGDLLQALGLYGNLKYGKMNLSITQPYDSQTVSGKLEIDKFHAIKTPFLTKIVSFISLPGIMGILTNNQEIAFNNLTSTFKIENGVVHIDRTTMTGPYFDIQFKAIVNTKEKEILAKGTITPSLYGINTLVSKLPILKQLFSAGRRKGLFFAPFSIKEKY